MPNISIGKLGTELAKELKNYSEDVSDKVNEKSLELANKAVKKLKETSPKRTGHYRKSWKVKTKKFVYRKGNIHIIHNTTSHSHLIEHGHAKRDGGRVEGIPHIAPVEKEVIEEFIESVEEIIMRGGD